MSVSGRWRRRELLAIQQFDGLAKRMIPGYQSNQPQGPWLARHQTDTSPDGLPLWARTAGKCPVT